MDHVESIRLAQNAREIRRKTLVSIFEAQTGHEGPSLSMVEILTLLYFKHLRFNENDPRDPDRDRLILSKGHGAPGLYATLAQVGILPTSELSTLRRLGSRLHGHPDAAALPGVDVSTGSLGQGLSIAVGLALGFRRKEMANRVYCILGDGELQEGQNWEAAMSAAKWRLSGLIAILDRNRLQGDGDTEVVMPLGDLPGKWRAFGWTVLEVDGHDFAALDRALSDAQTASGPAIIIANTTKGKGVSFMEGVLHWHHHPLDEASFKKAMAELQDDPHAPAQ